jgi:RNA polymerase sigma-70 factor (sigma-E family)
MDVGTGMLESMEARAGMRVAGPSEVVGFGEVFRSEHARALRLAYVLTADSVLAEEVVADVFVAMYPHWKRGGVDDAAAYVRRAVVNRVNSAFRRLAVRRNTELWTQRASAEGADVGIDDRDVVHRALLALPVGQRVAVALRYLDDLSEADTAEALGISVGTVKSQVARGLMRLRELLEPDEEGDAS